MRKPPRTDGVEQATSSVPSSPPWWCMPHSHIYAPTTLYAFRILVSRRLHGGTCLTLVSLSLWHGLPQCFIRLLVCRHFPSHVVMSRPHPPLGRRIQGPTHGAIGVGGGDMVTIEVCLRGF
jgi:hypothetical protein